MRLGLSVPLYNEQACVERTVAGLLDAMQGVPVQIALVNNGSTDDTGRLVNRLSIRHTQVDAVHLTENAGYGGGILAGLSRLETPVVGWTWGDGQVEPAVVRACWERLLEGDVDLVKARRVERQDGRDRALVSGVYGRVMRHAMGVTTPDVNGCPKLMPRGVYEQLALRSLDWFLDPEAILKAEALGLRIAHVDAVMRPRPGGESKVNWGTVRQFVDRLWAWRGGWRPGAPS